VALRAHRVLLVPITTIQAAPLAFLAPLEHTTMLQAPHRALERPAFSDFMDLPDPIDLRMQCACRALPDPTPISQAARHALNAPSQHTLAPQARQYVNSVLLGPTQPTQECQRVPSAQLVPIRTCQGRLHAPSARLGPT